MFGYNKLKKQISELTTKNSMLNDEILDYKTINQKLIREDEAYRISLGEKEAKIVELNAKLLNLDAEITEYKRVIEEQNKTIDSVNDKFINYTVVGTIYKTSEEVELLTLDVVQEQTVQEVKEKLSEMLHECMVVTTTNAIDDEDKEYLLIEASINVLKNNSI